MALSSRIRLQWDALVAIRSGTVCNDPGESHPRCPLRIASDNLPSELSGIAHLSFLHCMCPTSAWQGEDTHYGIRFSTTWCSGASGAFRRRIADVPFIRHIIICISHTLEVLRRNGFYLTQIRNHNRNVCATNVINRKRAAALISER